MLSPDSVLLFTEIYLLVHRFANVGLRFVRLNTCQRICTEDVSWPLWIRPALTSFSGCKPGKFASTRQGPVYSPPT